MSCRIGRLLPALLVTLLLLPGPVAAMQTDLSQLLSMSEQQQSKGAPPLTVMDEVRHAFIRLPLAALLGTALAVRPKRRGTPPRQPAVIQTQIILAIVGALVMLVVGSNLARAFGVVGAAGLVRYRAKVEDPKDAGVMLSTLALGLSCGVGQYVMAVISAGFILLALWVVESFEPEGKKLYTVAIKMGDDTDARRKEYEAILSRHNVDFALLTSSDDEVSYEAQVPLELERDRITTALLKLDPDGHASVEWAEKKSKSK
jgi:uncharacterized membrane protein YhiD involved in acid resistance